MKLPLLALAGMVAAATLLALTPTAAVAKGASAATIDGSGPGGPGNGPNGPITLRGDGEPGSGTDLSALADLTGLFPAMFGQSPDPMLAATPTIQLGPRCTITWTIPDGSGTARKVRQEVYPYAAGGPVTYTKPGQPVFDQTTRGGWYRSSDSLRRQLISLGLPNKAPLAAASGGSAASSAGSSNASPAPARPAAAAAPAAWPRVLGGGAILVLMVTATTVVVLRRRPSAASAR
ncbi:MAG TPA: hypothetical protein VGC06_11235 [Actinomycetes bacterium]